jgi:toxin-antitoxin system PIN domain toxin
MLIDANLLIHARNSGSAQHHQAVQWLESALNGNRRVGLPWVSLHAFLRISTNPRVFTRPLPSDLATEQVRAWLGSPMAWIPEPTTKHAEVLATIVRDNHVTGPLVTDAVLASIALEHGLTVYSTDADFARFSEIRWRNPLTQ